MPNQKKLNKHQTKMVKAIRNKNLETLSAMSSFCLTGGLTSSVTKYREEISKRLNRIFPFSIQYSQLGKDSIFTIANDFHFDHPEKSLKRKMIQIAKKIMASRPKDYILHDLIQIELAIALVYYSEKKDLYNLYGIPLHLKTNLWKFYPNFRHSNISPSPNTYDVRFDFDPYQYKLNFYPNPFASGRLSERGDPHNFGQRTVRRGKYFYKPREMQWEFFFLSKNSPLKSILPKDLARSLLHLEISLKNKTSKKITKVTKVRNLKKFWKQSGQTCAWATLFGMTDLHRGNVIISEEGPVIIDLETALLPLSNVEQTGLIDNSDESMKWATGFAELFELSRRPDYKFDYDLFISGFYDVLNWALKDNKMLLASLKENESTLSQSDNRFILRNSREYENQKSKFLPEERVQLSRRDVPYFYTHKNDPKVYFKVDPNGKSKSVKTIPPHARELLAKHQASITQVISPKRIKSLIKSAPLSLRGYFCEQ